MNLLSISWRERVFYPLAVAVMIGCCLFSVAQVLRGLAGGDADLYVIALVCVLAALQSFYTHRLVATRRVRGRRMWFLYLSEILFLLILAKFGELINDVIMGRPALFNFFSLDARWALTIIMVVPAWWFARAVARQFGRIHAPPYERQETEYIDPSWVSPYETLSSLFLWGGVVLLFFAGIARVSILELPNTARPPVTGLVLNVLIYFCVGLVLLGQARFDAARRRWVTDQVNVSQQMGSRWLRYSLILIGLAALLAFFIPISYSLGLLDALRVALEILMSIVGFIFYLAMLLLSLLSSLLNLLLGANDVAETPPPTPEPPQALFPSETATNNFWAWLNRLNWGNIQAIFSWLVAAAVIFYVVRSYLRDHPEFSQMLGRFAPFRVLARIWRTIWEWLSGTAQQASRWLPRDMFERLLSRYSPKSPRARLLRPGDLTFRGRVRFLYLSILYRAAAQGMSRRDDQTPYEYKGILGPRVPEVKDEIAQLTDAFVEARYSQHPLGSEDVALTYEAWLRVRSALRESERHRGSGAHDKPTPSTDEVDDSKRR